MRPQNIFNQGSYALELAELMTEKSKVLKFICGVCGYQTVPHGAEVYEALHINEYGVCLTCAKKDQVYMDMVSYYGEEEENGR